MGNFCSFFGFDTNIWYMLRYAFDSVLFVFVALILHWHVIYGMMFVVYFVNPTLNSASDLML